MTSPIKLQIISALLASAGALSVTAPANGQVGGVAATSDIKIAWDNYGVPRIKADNYRDLGVGYGYALADSRLCMLVDHVQTLRGERSKFYGDKADAIVGFLPTTNLNSDLFYRVQLADDRVESAFDALQPETKALLNGFVEGLNQYVGSVAKKEVEAACDPKRIEAFTVQDIVRIELSIGNTPKAFLVAPFAEQSARWGKEGDSGAQASIDAFNSEAIAAYQKAKLGIGSNAWAFGGDYTQGGGAILLGNPHTPWYPHWLSMYQAHLTIPGEVDVAGASFLGLPFPVTGFNRDVAWSILQASTVTWNYPIRMEVDVTSEHPSYIVNGVSKPLQFEAINIDILDAKGGISTRQFKVAQTEFGPLYNLPEQNGRPAGWYAVTDIGDGNAKGFDQFIAIAKSSDIGQFIDAVASNRGLGANLIAGDKYGDTAFIATGEVLDVDEQFLAKCRLPDLPPGQDILDGSKAGCTVQDESGRPVAATWDIYPAFVSRKVMHNSNNSYRSSLFGEEPKPLSFLFGEPEKLEFNLRNIMSSRRIDDISADGDVTSTEALQILMDNRNFAANEWLDEILAACQGAAPGTDAKTGCTVLANWDRKNDPDSQGALLFHHFWTSSVEPIAQSLLPSNNPADPQQPVKMTIDSGSGKVLLDGIGSSVKQLENAGFAPDAAWGSALVAIGNGNKIPMPGGGGGQGVLNVSEPGPLTDQGFNIQFGSSFIQLVRWENGELIADVLMAHGQSFTKESEERAAQLKLFSEGKLYRYPFSNFEQTGKFTKSVSIDPKTLEVMKLNKE